MEGRLIWVTAAVSGMNGFDLLLGNDALAQLGNFSVQYNEAGVGSFSTKSADEEETLRGKAGYVVNRETLSIPAFSMVYVDTVVQSTGGCKTSFLVEPSPKVMADKGISMGRLLIISRAIGGVKRFPLNNFSSTDQFIPAGMVVGKILLVDQVVEDIRAVDPISPKGEEPLPFVSRINPDLTEEEKGKAAALLDRYSGCFAKTSNELGCSNLVKHKIDTREHLPLHQPPYASVWRERELIDEQTRTMLKNKVTVHSNSPWASPVFW